MEDLQRRLEAVEEVASNERDSSAQLAAKLSKTEGDLRSKAQALAVAESEAQTLRQQLQVSGECGMCRGRVVQSMRKLGSAPGSAVVSSSVPPSCPYRIQDLSLDLPSFQETHQARVRAQGALGSADDELQRLQRDAAMLARQLDEEHGELERTLAAKGSLEVCLCGIDEVGRGLGTA